MIVLRPVRLEDLHEVKSMAAEAGLASLPNDLGRLKYKIEHSLHSFAKHVEIVRDEHYLFILEDLKSKQICGICGIQSRTGVSIPAYYYLIDVLPPLPVGLKAPHERRILIPIQFIHHPSELGSIFLKPEYRRDGLGRLLSLSRFLFIAEHRKRFKNSVIANLRGVIDKNGVCPFWDAIGKKYLDMTFHDAFEYFVSNREEYFTKVLPQFPIYVGMLPQEVQDTIGQPHVNSQPALSMLMKEGFKIGKYIDVFDGGPTIEADLKDVRSIRDSHLTQVGEVIADGIVSDLYIIANNKLNFRACYGHIKLLPSGQVVIQSETAEALGLKKGEWLRFVSPAPHALAPYKKNVTELITEKNNRRQS